MQTADRLSKIPPYLFVTLRNKINKARSEGVDVISLGVGDPVDPTPQSVIDELCRQAQIPINHQYPIDEEKGMLAFRQETANWYRKRYGVEVSPEGEVVGLIGSKEGCHHFVLGVANPGDVILMTSPGYPGYRASIYMGNAEPYEMPILDEGNYLPDFDQIPSEIVKRAKGMFLNYPNNPTGACATREFFGKAVEFAKAHDIAICHDNPYSEVVFDGQERLSFLAVPGAKDVGIELNSLSKPYNMTGWRIGMAMGNRQIIAAICKVKENTDSGIFNAIQYAAIAALQKEDANIAKMMDIYYRRRKLVLDTLEKIGLKFKPQPGTFYLWIPAPKGMSSIDFTTLLFEKAAVVVAAGTAYGKYGEGYVRISLTVPDKRLAEAMERIRKIF
ncbi:MAG: aminotransferase class I/II-fold pyridoxal phosphate-dependent enzyme [Deltaproteobacteria bacterium]|nr:MAG: aminotransferase class I/II-fold pyridoxal phosphate-dependent enzyme [Deltaproteobacteria bacterium]